MTTVQIKHRFTDVVLFTCEVPDEQSGLAMLYALEKATQAGANLYGANLARANLARANLDGANLDGANLYGANLARANLDGANLYGANLDGANLYGANLDGANLYGANLDGANLYGANLDGETLSCAPISIANLRWPVLITPGFLRIGCQRHSHAEWLAFDDESIEAMDGDALKFWSRWKAPLLAMCAAQKGSQP